MQANVNAYLVVQSKQDALSPHFDSLELSSATRDQEPAAHKRSVTTVCIGSAEIPVYIKRGRRSSKNVYLKLKMNYELEITIPPGTRVDIEGLLEEKRGWIERQYQKLTKCKPIFCGTRVLYKGSYRNVVTIASLEGTHHDVTVHDHQIVIHYTAGVDPRIPLMNWMRAETIRYVVARTHELAKQFGVVFRDVYVRDIRAWGCCRRNGDLFFAWQLIALPDALAEYVVLHELTHLLEFNHSQTFKAKLATLCPDYKERRRRLKEVILSPMIT